MSNKLPEVVHTIAELKTALAKLKAGFVDSAGPAQSDLAAGVAQSDLALVPTMGALHQGHLSLVKRANDLAKNTVVSIFVNPLQFGVNEDFDKYPRVLDNDLELLSSLNVALVFAPSPAEMYPNGQPETRVAAGAASTSFEGASRPGHFDGMLTVVLKLMMLVEPDIAIFGQKDAQQVHLIQTMVRDFNLPQKIVVAPIVREPDGLALSSRNRYLSDSQHKQALLLSKALRVTKQNAAQGVTAALSAGKAVLESDSGIKLDYLAAVSPETFTEVAADYRGAATVILAVAVGSTRLIDNAVIVF